MGRSAARHAIIIGGGASGGLLAYQLLTRPGSDFRVTLIERGADVGRGLAYDTRNPEHLLNVRVANMSALPDDPEHFWRWLCAQEVPVCPDPFCFVPRHIYGAYIASLIAPLAARNGTAPRLTIVRSECVDISEGPSSVTATLANGARCHGDVAILATGHDAAAAGAAHLAAPWAAPAAARIDENAAILILGTGLTMVDHVLS